MSAFTSCMKHFLMIACIDKNEGKEFFSLGRAYNNVNNSFKVRKWVFDALIANLIKYPALCIFNFNESSVYCCHRHLIISILSRAVLTARMIGPAVWKQ